MTIYELIVLNISHQLHYKIKVTDHWIRINGLAFYCWKEINKSYYNPFKHAPKSFTHTYWSKHRQKEKSALNRELKGLEANYPYNHKHSAIWNYW